MTLNMVNGIIVDSPVFISGVRYGQIGRTITLYDDGMIDNVNLWGPSRNEITINFQQDSYKPKDKHILRMVNGIIHDSVNDNIMAYAYLPADSHELKLG